MAQSMVPSLSGEETANLHFADEYPSGIQNFFFLLFIHLKKVPFMVGKSVFQFNDYVITINPRQPPPSIHPYSLSTKS